MHYRRNGAYCLVKWICSKSFYYVTSIFPGNVGHKKYLKLWFFFLLRFCSWIFNSRKDILSFQNQNSFLFAFSYLSLTAILAYKTKQIFCLPWFPALVYQLIVYQLINLEPRKYSWYVFWRLWILLSSTVLTAYHNIFF